MDTRVKDMKMISYMILLLGVNVQALSSEANGESLLDRHDQFSNTTIMYPKLSALHITKQLEPPSIDITSGGEVEGIEFWQLHDKVLHQAWDEWWKDNLDRLPTLLEDEIMNSELNRYIQILWKNPTVQHEHNIHSSLWSEPIPGVFVCRNFFTTTGIRAIRQHLSEVEQVPIPTRRPNGMNRNGIVIDEATPGGVSYQGLMSFRNWLVDSYFRPLGRMFFPEYSGRGEQDDIEAYAFTVHYHSDNDNGLHQFTSHILSDDGSRDDSDEPPPRSSTRHDVKLPEHSDASLFTLSINLNLPKESFSGSELLFAMSEEDRGGTSHEMTSINFEPGMAVLHRGLHRHEAQPLLTGSRHQLIIWLFGDQGYVRSEPYGEHERREVNERWTGLSHVDAGVLSRNLDTRWRGMKSGDRN